MGWVDAPVFLGLTLSEWTQTIIGAILGGIIGGLAGFLASLGANRSYHDWLAPVFELDVDQSDLAPKLQPAPGRLSYFHVLLSAPAKLAGWRGRFLGDRRIPKGVSARVKIFDPATRTLLVDEGARWVSWPRPIYPFPVPPVPMGAAPPAVVFDEQLAAGLEYRDFKPSREGEQLDLVVKAEGDTSIYFWNNWSYDPTRLRTLGPGTYNVKFLVHCEGKAWEWCFRVSNGGPSWANVTVEKIPCASWMR